MVLSEKQTTALDYLEDNITTELLYGGGAGGGKSILGCYWLLKCSLKYADTRWLMGRAVGKTLKETTFVSFLKVCKMQGLIAGKHYRITSAQDRDNPNCIVFPNRSVILMKDLYAYPADPEFDELGSLEITGAFIDEANQVSVKAKQIVRSRIRHNLTEHGLIPKMLMTCNPAKNWVYSDFYRPSKDGTLPGDMQFIQALVGDNPDIDPTYYDSLLKLDQKSKERLLYGNWEYLDDPSILIEYDKILDAFTNTVEPGDKYITVDVARFGSDKTVIAYWDGFRVKMWQYKGLGVTEVADKIQEFQKRFKVPNSQTVADEDGVGGGVVDILRCKGFVNNSRPLPNPVTKKDENYANLKSQCYFMLAENINAGLVGIECDDPEMKQSIIQELEQVKQHNMDKDGKKQVIPKDKVKELIGRSPDFSDALMMRMFFELTPKRKWVAA